MTVRKDSMTVRDSAKLHRRAGRRPTRPSFGQGGSPSAASPGHGPAAGSGLTGTDRACTEDTRDLDDRRGHPAVAPAVPSAPLPRHPLQSGETDFGTPRGRPDVVGVPGPDAEREPRLTQGR
jgi:hypothetical protein